jgi:transcriptional repressor NrdR
MVCPYCNSSTSVVNSRPQKRTNSIWRRRRCDNCQAVFTSTEQIDLEKSLVIARLGSLQPFLRDNLFISVHDSLRHRKTALRDATALTDTIIARLLPLADNGTLDRDQIVTITTVTLEHFDTAAAVQYAAFHPVRG